ncbi:MAG: Coenzyme F420 hydrogenase/dehydrogenase, beta subunit C-terminal domain [Lachnospiraceae bacterium]|nr:Coenzyme F420 hydrogenase/dehydrogenase, beta subunit C-terminal domain [Lachnospiraceae bacterium]
MNNTSKVIDLVVKNDLCIGCGLCTYKCPNKAIEMKWNEYGFITPVLSGSCDNDGSCLSVCPFNPFPAEEVKTEDELANIFLNEAPNHHPKIGKYYGLYAGYSNEFRKTSSSGGIATFVLSELLEQKIVNYIFSVKESSSPESHYEYAISKTKDELIAGAKTRYYPVTLATVFSEIDKIDGSIAIVGVGCFIKAIRLAQHTNPELKTKIKFLVGIICGGVKSRFFTEYLANRAGVPTDLYYKPEFRIKDLNSTASDYSFGCFNKKTNEFKSIKMRRVGDMWGTGLFKNNACDFCDDVTTELADISLGDAWLQPYVNEGHGSNVIVTRSILAENILDIGIRSKQLNLNTLEKSIFLSSQQGSFNHRHDGLKYRISKSREKGVSIPEKRNSNIDITIDFKFVQKARMIIRKKSLETWKSNTHLSSFTKEMHSDLILLRRKTIIYHYRKKIFYKIRKILNL